MPSSQCPSPGQLEQLLDEQLDEAAHQAVSLHINACPACRQALERLTEEPAESVSSLSLLRRGSPADTPPPEGAAPFLARLKQTPPTPATGRVEADSRSMERPAVPGYEILGVLGRGGMGVVYKARQVGLNRLVALKMILSGPHTGPRGLARFLAEAEAVARLRHPNIVQIYDIGKAAGCPYFALEFVEGGSLARQLRGDPQPLEPAVRLVETLARAIHVAHGQGIVHRDLKPANILLAARGLASRDWEDAQPQAAEAVPKITDFGLAKRLDEQGNGTQTGEVVGTPSYMAPEQAAAQGPPIGPATDVYALGAILYELLTGRPPFKGATVLDTVVQVLHEEPVRPSRLRPGLPRDLETICLKCLEKDPHRRYSSAEALAEDVHCFRQGKPITARPVGPFERTAKWVRRRPLIAALLAAIVLVTVLGFAGVTWQWQEARSARDVAVAERRKTRTALYASRIVQSQLQWRVGDLAGARQSLQQCLPPPGQEDRRGWEWHYLGGLFHADLLTLNHPFGGPGGAVALRPDGRWIASVVGGFPAGEEQPGGEVRIWEATDGQLVRTLAVPGTVHRLAFAPDGEGLALAGTDGTVLMWDTTQGKELLRRQHHTQAAVAVAFSPDGNLLASAGSNGNLKIWQVGTGRVIQSLTGHTGAVLDLAFSPDSRYLAYGGGDATVRVWDVDSGVERFVFRGHAAAVESVQFSPDGRRLASFSPTEVAAVKVWDLTRHPDYATFARTRGRDAGSVKVRDLLRRPTAPVLAQTGPDVEALAFQAGGARVVSVTVGGTLQTWDATTGVLLEQQVVSMSEELVSPAVLAAFSPGGEYLAARAREDNRLVRVWDTATGGEVAPLRGHTLPVLGVRFSADGQRLVTCGCDLAGKSQAHEIKVWAGPREGKVLATLPGRGLVFHLALSPDGRWLALAGANGVVSLLDWSSRGQGVTLAEHKGPVGAVAFSPDGRRLASAGLEDRTVYLWEVQGLTAAHARSPGPLHTIGAPSLICDLAFSPDGRRLAGVSRDVVKMWDVGTGHLMLTLRGASQRHWDPAFNPRILFSPDGKRLAATNWDETISVWEAETPEGEEAAAGHRAARRQAADARAAL